MNLSVIIEPYGSHVTVSNSPYCQKPVIPYQDAQRCFGGTAFELFLTVFRVAKLDFTLYRVKYFYPNDKPHDVWELVKLLLVQEKVDFSAAFWSNRDNRKKDFYFVLPSIMELPYEYTVIEKERNYNTVSLWESFKFNNVFALFDVWIWTLSGFWLLFCAVVLTVCQKRSKFGGMLDNVFGLYRIAVNQSEAVSNQAERITCIWSFMALITMSCFTGLIFMKTTVQPGWVQPFIGLESMLSAGYKFVILEFV